MGASNRHRAFIIGEHLMQSLYLSGGTYKIEGVYLRVDVYKIISGILETQN